MRILRNKWKVEPRTTLYQTGLIVGSEWNRNRGADSDVQPTVVSDQRGLHCCFGLQPAFLGNHGEALRQFRGSRERLLMVDFGFGEPNTRFVHLLLAIFV